MTALLIIGLAFAIVALLVAVCFVVGGLLDAQANESQLRTEVACLKVSLENAVDRQDLYKRQRDRARSDLDELRSTLRSDSRCRTAAECARNLSAVYAAQRPDDTPHQCPENLCGRDYPTDLELAAHLVAKHPQPGDKAA